MTIGRSRESDIFLPDQWLSRHHAEIVQRSDGYFVVDLQSKNGTLLNGQPVKEDGRLRDGDIITLGEHTLTFVADEGTEEEFEPEGTRVFSIRELSDINTKPAIDPAELQRQNRVLATLSKAASELVIHRPLAELFDTILKLLFEAVTAERGAILLLEGEPRVPRIKASKSTRGEPLTKVSRSIGRRVMEDRVALLLPNVLEDARFKAEDQHPLLGHPLRHVRPSLVQPRGRLEGRRDRPRLPRLAAALALLRRRRPSHPDRPRERGRRQDRERAPARGEHGDARPRGRHADGGGDPDAASCRGRPRQCQATAWPAATTPAARWAATTTTSRSKSGRLMLALGDVSGKGTAAALIMTVLRAAVRGHWTEGFISEAVARINRTRLPEHPLEQVRHLLPRRPGSRHRAGSPT